MKELPLPPARYTVIAFILYLIVGKLLFSASTFWDSKTDEIYLWFFSGLFFVWVIAKTFFLKMGKRVQNKTVSKIIAFIGNFWFSAVGVVFIYTVVVPLIKFYPYPELFQEKAQELSPFKNAALAVGFLILLFPGMMAKWLAQKIKPQ